MDKSFGERRRSKGINIGVTSIAVLFVSLCMTIFAVLALSTSGQERETAERYADSVSAYWAADRDCAEIADAFGALWQAGADASALQDCAKRYQATVTEADGAVYVSYSRPIAGAGQLSVRLRLDDEFAVEQWRQESGDEWSPDAGIDLWTGK